jgi:GxxExxY protein
MHPLYEQADKLTKVVIEAALKVQKHFGIGLLESIYMTCLERELTLRGHVCSIEQSVKIEYEGMVFVKDLRYDLLVDNCLLIEGKSKAGDIVLEERQQLLSYMQLLNMPLGLVMNFSCPQMLKRGVRRVILKGADSANDF